MAQAFVLGNGISRQGIDLTSLNLLGPIYGCNALYRDFAPNVLVATDRDISEHIQQSGYAINHVFYTRRPLAGQGARPIPEPYWRYSSGPAAIALAAQAGHTLIWMLGFDLGPDQDQKFNNVYAGTEFYKPTGSAPTYTQNWVQQILSVCKEFGHVRFARVVGNTTATIPAFDGIPNFKTVTLADFLQQVNSH